MIGIAIGIDASLAGAKGGGGDTLLAVVVVSSGATGSQVNSPYTPPANMRCLCKTSTGPITIALAATPIGSVVQVDDYDNDSATNNITVTPPAGWQLDDPNALGAYLALNASAKISINGATSAWSSDGNAIYKSE